MNNIYNVLLGMIETEKTVKRLQPNNQYTFIVTNGSTKIDVRKAVEKLYWVTVLSVNKTPVRKKIRQVWRWKIITKRKAFIKAIVTIKPTEKIDLIAIQDQK